ARRHAQRPRVGQAVLEIQRPRQAPARRGRPVLVRAPEPRRQLPLVLARRRRGARRREHERAQQDADGRALHDARLYTQPWIERGETLCYLHGVAKGKITKKELRQPDEFVSFWTRAAEQAGKFASERKRALIGGGTMLVTVVAGSLIFSAVQESRGKQATAT